MVARINTGKKISMAINYNEHKLKQGIAELLSAQNFMKDAEHLNFYDKLHHFQKMTSLNEKAKTNTLHVSLNFDPSEKLSNEKMKIIADRYMQKIGFSNQPYLVYRHNDSAHPHLHIVSTNIQRDGSRISMHNLGKNQSETARKEIETEFDLVKAENKKLKSSLQLHPVNAEKINYGKLETKRAISNVLAVVVNQYKYTSLAELNAVLSLYNVKADRGEEGSRIYQNKGLNYRVLDEYGEKIGMPIKASSIYFKPTLEYLENKMGQNESQREQHKKRIKLAIDWTLKKNMKDLPEFIRTLEKEKISTVLRQNKTGQVYGVTFVDHVGKTVFNGSDIGREYSIKNIEAKLTPAENLKAHQSLSLRQNKNQSVASNEKVLSTTETSETVSQNQHEKSALEIMMASTQTNDFTPYQLKKSKRKRKRLRQKQ